MGNAIETLSTGSAGVTAPAANAFPVTPNDSADLATTARSLLIGTAGDLRVTTLAGDTVTLTGVPAGVLPLAVVRVFNTSTTASNIAALV
jgi:hypothetical protein